MGQYTSGTDLQHLIQLVAKLPGLGPRSARRAVLHLLKHKETLMEPLAALLSRVGEAMKSCEICGNIDTVSPCTICLDDARISSLLCAVEDIEDLWALERGGIFRGRYHVLGGVLSALNGKGPDDLAIGSLIERVAAGGIEEVIIATNATVEGQTTAHYIGQKLAAYPVKVSKLAHGIPIGGELDYLDEGTLGAALKARQAF